MPAHLIAEEGPLRGLVLNLEEGSEWTLGRDAEVCDFYIEDSTVSRKHVRIYKAPEGIYLKNLSRINPTLVNDEEHSKPVLLKEGDRVQIGSNTFLFSEEAIPDFAKEPEKKDDIFENLEGEEKAEAAAESPDMPPNMEKPEPAPYDTIFEDTGAEEDLPFNLAGDAPLALKVVAGPNAGAEIGIEKGKTYTIGKDPDSCDIVFQDLSVSRHHAKLLITEDGMMRIEDLDSKNGVAVNGSLITQPTGITAQDLIALGTTVFMVIDREAPQDTIYSPIPHNINIPAPVEEVVVDEELVEPQVDWKREKIQGKYLVMAGSAAMVFFVVFLSFFSLFKSNEVEGHGKESVSQIKEALAKFEGVKYSYNPGSGRIFLVGHVTTGVDYQEMRYRIGQIGFINAVEDTVVIDEGVARAMNDVISANPNWRAVSVQTPEPGKFNVVGYVTSAADAAELSEYLTVNFPYLDLLQNKVVAEEDLSLELQALLLSKDLGAVAVQLSNGNVVLSGRYSEDRSKAFDKMVKEMHHIPGVASVKSFAVAVTPKMAAIDLTTVYRVSGSSVHEGKGFSVVMNGKIHTLGDFVDGMKITEIDPNMILLEKDGLKFRIDYTL